MKIAYFIPLLLFCVSCTNEKTEITIELSPSIYMDVPKDQLSPDMAIEMQFAKDDALAVIAARIKAAAEPVNGLVEVLNEAEVTTEQGIDPDKWKFIINRKVDPKLAEKVLETRLEFGFYETYMLTEILEFLVNAGSIIKESVDAGSLILPPDTSLTALTNDINPLFRFLVPMFSAEGQPMEGSTIGNARVSDTALINRMLSMESVQYAFPRNLRLLWSYKPWPGTDEFYSLVALKVTSFGGRPLLNDKNIVEASADLEKYPPSVEMKMDNEGAQLWQRITSDNINRDIAVIVNNRVYMHPRVMGEITGGKSTISADFTEEEARELAIILGSGYMPQVNVEVISVNTQ